MAAPGAPPFALHRRRIGAALLALAVGGAISAPPARAQGPAATQRCTLHVTGAKPRPFKRSMFVRVKGPLPNPDDPATSAYQYNPATRAMALTDAELRSLFPATTELEIVRHPEGMTKAALNSATGVIYPRRSVCHAELIVSDVVGVFPSTASADRLGLVGSLLAGGDRIELIFTFRRFDAGKDRPLKTSSREDGSLAYPDPAAPTAVLAEAITRATSKAFADFAGTVARRQRTAK